MKNVLLILVIAIISMGCATKPIPPGNYNPQTSATINKSYDETWTAITEWFGVNNVNVKAMEKDSGLITAETTRFPESNYDCGSQSYTADTDITGRFNVFAKPDGDQTLIRLTIDVIGERCSKNGYGQIMYDSCHTVNCSSRGLFESTFFNDISQ